MRYFERGSEWRKWDLHIHTKDTNKNDQFESEDFEKFCIAMFKEALEKEICAIGITDYFEIKNFYKVKKFVEKIGEVESFNNQEKERIQEIFILPNIELRMLPTTDSGNLINIHCIFNPIDEVLKLLNNDFFASLETPSGKKMNRDGFVALGRATNSTSTDEEAHKIGIEQFHIESSQLGKLFKNNPMLRENSIIVVSNSSNDGASATRKHYKLFGNEPGALDSVRREIYSMSDAIFSGNPKDRLFFLGEKENSNKDSVISDCGSLKPCFHGSDAHSEQKLFSPDQDRFCWIKADLTFEGLKQTICEPKDRVIIQLNKPEEKTGYHVIKSVEINHSDCNQKILLNPNLNTIIGGRSTGKSTLLQLIANGINPNIELNEYVQNIASSLTVTWQDDTSNVQRDIEFFPQNHMFDIARDIDKKDELIQTIVKGTEANDEINTYQKLCLDNRKNIQAQIDRLFDLQNEISEQDHILKTKGDKVGLETEINAINHKIQQSHQNDKFSKEDLVAFRALENDISNIEQIQNKINTDIKEISLLREEEIFNPLFIDRFNQLSEINAEDIKNSFSLIKEQAIILWTEQLSNKLEELRALIQEYTDNIDEKKNEDVFKRGIAYLEANKQNKELHDRLVNEKKKLAEITEIEKRIKTLNDQKENLLSLIVKGHIKYSEELGDLTKKFLLEHDDIKIRILKTYRESECKDKLKEFINLQSYERQEFVSKWKDNYLKDPQSLLESFIFDVLENKISLKQYKNNADLAKAIFVENWFSISYEITYQNDTFDKMSDGKKAFVILKLLLEFSDKKCPILIDQPEDSLDNRAIYNELVSYLKEKKKERQIILVTHNANIVVNADAEEVIIANQHGEDTPNKGGVKFQYISGSLENTVRLNRNTTEILKSQGIREHVCEILEGGTEAFKKRENKYAIAE